MQTLRQINENAPDSDVEDYLYQIAEKDANTIIDIYTGSDQALKLLLIDAKQNRVITNKSGVFMYSDTALGVTDEAVILFLKDPKNKAIFDSLKVEVYPDMDRTSEPSKPTKK